MTESDDDLTRYVITRLGRSANRDDLILEVCQRKSIDWNEAEAWIHQVTEEHGRAVARRQAPAFIALCAIAGISGLAMAASAFEMMIQPFLAYLKGLNQIAALAGYTVVLWHYVPQFIAGAGLIAGATVGFVKIASKLRYNEPLDS